MRAVPLRHVTRPGRAAGKPRGARISRNPWAPRLLTLVLAGVFLTAAGVAMAMLAPLTAAWLDRLPEHYSLRARTLAANGETEAAIEVALARSQRVAYDFEPFWLAAELALEQQDRRGVIEAADAMTRALERGLSANARQRQEQIPARAWSEGRAIGYLGVLLLKMRRLDEGSGIIRQGRRLDAARTNRMIDKLASYDPTLYATTSNLPPPRASQGELPGVLWWPQPTTDALKQLTTPEGKPVAGARYGSASGDIAAGVVLTRRSRFRLVPPKDTQLVAGQPVLLHLRVKGTPAFDGWPMLLMQAAAEQERARGIFAACVAESPEWIDVTLGPFPMPSGPLDFHYYNDEYDADLKQDRNLILGEMRLQPVGQPAE